MTSTSILSGSSNFLYSKLTSKTQKTDKHQLSAEALSALTPGANSIDATGNQKVLPITDYLKTESSSLSMDRSVAARTNVDAQLAAQQQQVPAQTPAPSVEDMQAGTIDSANAKPKTAKEEFLEYAHKSPAEKMRDMILQELGLTEEELQAMSPEQREAIEKKITEVLKEKMKEAMQKQSSEDGTSSTIDISSLA